MQDTNQHKNQHINQAVGEQNKGKKVIFNQKTYQQINQHLNQHINQNVKQSDFYSFNKMNKGDLYRIRQIHEIEKEIHFEKIKQELGIKKHHRVISFCHVCFMLLQFFMFLLNVGFLSNFQEIKGNISEKILQGSNLLFGSVSIFLKVIEKYLFKKIQKHEKQKTLIENQINSIWNMVSKALSNNEISEGEFEKILSQISKWTETYRSFDEMNLEFPKPEQSIRINEY